MIEAKQGEDAPGYRGLCYLVFERLPIGQFGNRIPNISVELCRVVGELEPAITAITSAQLLKIVKTKDGPTGVELGCDTASRKGVKPDAVPP